jgi:hypothetical protein
VTDGISTVKRNTVARNLNRNPRLAARVERALVRAGIGATHCADVRDAGYVWESGRVVAKRPYDRWAIFVARGGRIAFSDPHAAYST